jgi:hypothetical protein
VRGPALELGRREKHYAQRGNVERHLHGDCAAALVRQKSEREKINKRRAVKGAAFFVKQIVGKIETALSRCLVTELFL